MANATGRLIHDGPKLPPGSAPRTLRDMARGVFIEPMLRMLPGAVNLAPWLHSAMRFSVPDATGFDAAAAMPAATGAWLWIARRSVAWLRARPAQPVG